MTPLSRRRFLMTSGGLLVLAACGGDDSGRGSSATSSSLAAGAATGDTVLVRFFSDGVQAAGVPQRLPFGLGDANGVLSAGGPEELVFTILDSTGAAVGEQVVARHAEGLPRPYWPVRLELTAAGIYTASTSLDGGTATSSFTIQPGDKVAIPKPGDRMIPVDTPTVADARGVTPICTRQPPCPLHDVTLSEALASGRPVAVLIGTPAYCQTGTCGPVLDVLLDQREQFPGIAMVHAEIYVDPEKALSSGATSAQGADLGAVTEAVKAYQLPFEPVLYLATADGVVASRLDSVFDASELAGELAALS